MTQFSMELWTALHRSIWLLMLKESTTATSWWDGVQTTLNNWSIATRQGSHRLVCSSRSGNRRHFIVRVRARPWHLSHLLHLLHIREPLRSRRKTIHWILYEVLLFGACVCQMSTVHSVIGRVRLLIWQAESRLCKHMSVGVLKTLGTWLSLITFLVFKRSLSIGHTLLRDSLEPIISRAEDGILVSVCHLFVLVDREEEGLSLLCHLLILDWNHLVEVYCLPLVLDRWLLVVKSDWASTEGFQMISCAQLEV